MNLSRGRKVKSRLPTREVVRERTLWNSHYPGHSIFNRSSSGGQGYKAVNSPISIIDHLLDWRMARSRGVILTSAIDTAETLV